MFNLKIIIASTREGRKGPAIAKWIFEKAGKFEKFQSELVDLKEINLPFLDEPQHPRHRKYTRQHTKDWSSKIESSDAFILVTPEYNFAFPATLKNALDFLYHEWAFKPVAFVSYGGISAGTRAVQMLKLVTEALKMYSVPSCVSIPFFTKYLDEKNNFKADERLDKSAIAMFEDLQKWTELLKGFRNAQNANKN